MVNVKLESRESKNQVLLRTHFWAKPEKVFSSVLLPLQKENHDNKTERKHD